MEKVGENLIELHTPTTEKICTAREETGLQYAENDAETYEDTPSGSKTEALYRLLDLCV
jgi:hypothetical protein